MFYADLFMQAVEKDVNICPNGVVFVKPNIRKGVLSMMVEEILNTRLMVKKSMKNYKEDKVSSASLS
jgi:DNA polymerase zeta